MASPLKPTRRAQITLLSSTLLFFVFIFVFWSTKPPIHHHNFVIKTLNTPPVPLPVIPRDLIVSASQRETDVANRIAKPLFLSEGKDKNMVFSPLSVHVVLSLIAAGTNGPARDQLLSFLKSNSTDELNALAAYLVPLIFADGSGNGGPSLSFANGLWVDESLNIKPSFKEVVDVFYKAVANKVDFKNKAEEVRIEVNSWAEEKTGGLIKEFFAPGSIDDLTRLVFSNALYFKGDWEKKFDVSKTKEYEFYLLSGRSVQAHFMSTDRWQYLREFDGFKVLELPYRQGGEEEGKPPQRRFSMYIILPVAKDGAASFVGQSLFRR